MKRDFAYIRAYEHDLIRKDRKRNDLYNALWNMVYLNWDFLPEHKAKMKNVRTLVDSSPSDAITNASIALSNHIPLWEVSPYSSSLQEFQRTEKLEHCLDTHFRKMNQAGVGSLLYDKMFSSLLYDQIVTRIDDLEFQFKGVRKLSPLQKRVRAQGRFLGECFDPRTIHTETSMGTFSTLLHVENMRAWDVYTYWKLYENNETDDGKRVARALAQMDAMFMDKTPTEVRDLRFVMYEFINDDQILKHGHFKMGDTLNDPNLINDNYTSSANDIVFADSENDLGFINWSVRIGGTRMEKEPAYQVNPMLAPLHWGNTWQTINVVRSLVMSEPISRIFEPHQFQQTQNGQRLPESDDGVIVGQRGDEAHNLPPATLDPQALSIVQNLQQELARTTGVNSLFDISAGTRTSFASINAMLQIAMSRLDRNRMCGELSIQDDALLMLRWVDLTKVPLLSYRRAPKSMTANGQTLQMDVGEQVTITADDFDLDLCEVNVSIKPKTPTDFQQQVLSAIQLHDKMQVPLDYLLEKFVGIENVPLLRNQYEDELLHNAQVQTAIQVMSQQMMAKAQQQMQQDAQAQQQAQQSGNGQGGPMTSMPNAGQGMSQSAMGSLGGGQGFNPAAGGASTSNFQPGLTRETVSGQTQDGQAIVAGG